MHRPANVTTRQRLKNRVSVVPAAEPARNAVVRQPVLARVRDGLVLRLVAKTKSRTKSESSGRGAR